VQDESGWMLPTGEYSLLTSLSTPGKAADRPAGQRVRDLIWPGCSNNPLQIPPTSRAANPSDLACYVLMDILISHSGRLCVEKKVPQTPASDTCLTRSRGPSGEPVLRLGRGCSMTYWSSWRGRRCPRPRRHPALLAPPRHRSAQLPHRPRRPLLAQHSQRLATRPERRTHRCLSRP
jgi:hypothetical protein